jgi:hypothetical protein
MKINRNQTKVNENQWKSMEIKQKSTKVNGNQWKSNKSQ